MTPTYKILRFALIEYPRIDNHIRRIVSLFVSTIFSAKSKITLNIEILEAFKNISEAFKNISSSAKSKITLNISRSSIQKPSKIEIKTFPIKYQVEITTEWKINYIKCLNSSFPENIKNLILEGVWLIEVKPKEIPFKRENPSSLVEPPTAQIPKN